MAHEIIGGPVTIPAAAQPLHTLLGIPDIAVGSLGIQAETAGGGQAARFYIGKDASVTAAGANAIGYCDPGGSYAFPPMPGSCRLRNVYLVGTAEDKAFVGAVVY